MDSTTPTDQNQYVLLRADKLRLLIPQVEVAAIQHLEGLPEPSGMPGLLAVPGQDDACYIVLADDLHLLESCPADRYVTTLMHSDDGMQTYWCWSEARVLLDYIPELNDVPEVLLAADSPLREYALMDEEPVFLCSAEVLQNLALGVGQ